MTYQDEATPTNPTPTAVRLPDEAIEDLGVRLDSARWPDEPEGLGWDMGVTVARVRALAQKLRELDWRAVEARVNEVPQVECEIDGAKIHAFHARSERTDALPLLMCHGWPSSPLEFLPLIEALTAPPEDEPAFHVIAPSIPGYAFSGPTTERGWTTKRIAGAFAALMQSLGYERYAAHGGDVGSGVVRELATIDAEHLIGGHVLEAFSFPSGDEAEMARMRPEDWERLGVAQRFQAEFAGYQLLQQRRPQTLAFALADSPVGQLAWIADFWDQFGDHPSHAEQEIVETAALYWLTNTSASAARVYYEDEHTDAATIPPSAPLGVAVFPRNFLSVRMLAERDNPTIEHWSEPDDGGHFAAIDNPTALVTDLRTFFGGRK